MDGSVVFAKLRQCAKMFTMATCLRTSKSAMSSSDSLTPKRRKPTARIKQRVATYHTTKVITQKATYSKLCPKIGCHGNVPQHRWTPSNTIPWAHPSPQPEWHLDRFGRLCTDDRGVSLYFTLPPQNCPFPWVHLHPYLIHGSLAPPESPTQTASRSVQPFLHSSLV